MRPQTSAPPHSRMRTYGQYCPVAAGLDVIGDRWVLLIMRELVAQPSRFTDLRRALPGLAPNLLTERLRDLQSAGLVESAEVSESSGRSIYRITDEGRKIIPVLRAVARFGVDFLDPAATPNLPAEGLSPARIARAFLLPWLMPGAKRMRVRLTVPDGSCADVVVDGRRTVIVDADPSVRADVELHTDALALSEVRRTGAPLEATLSGSATAKDSFQKAFDLDCH